MLVRSCRAVGCLCSHKIGAEEDDVEILFLESLSSHSGIFVGSLKRLDESFHLSAATCNFVSHLSAAVSILYRGKVTRFNHSLFSMEINSRNLSNNFWLVNYARRKTIYIRKRTQKFGRKHSYAEAAIPRNHLTGHHLSLSQKLYNK